MVIREKDGTLRTPTTDEHEMYNHVFYPATYQKRQLPPMFQPAALKEMLQSNLHVDLLDEISRCRQPHQRDYIRVHASVYDNVDSRRIYNILQDTPHWTRFIDYLVTRNQVSAIEL